MLHRIGGQFLEGHRRQRYPGESRTSGPLVTGALLPGLPTSMLLISAVRRARQSGPGSVVFLALTLDGKLVRLASGS